jgi:hypothetical protein
MTDCLKGAAWLVCAVAMLRMFAEVQGAPDEKTNLARLPGVIAIVDSEHRDRWGVDGYHAANLCDGVIPANVTQAWASDNWEVTHTAALVFPQRVHVARFTFHWLNNLTPRHATLQGWGDGKWIDLAQLTTDADVPSSTINHQPSTIEAVRLVQPPDGANPRTDRRLWMGEMEVFGEVTDEKVDAAKRVEQLRAELRQWREREDAARVKPQLDVVMQRRKPRGFMGIINAEDVKRGRENVKKRAWAKSLADNIIKDADWWAQQSDEYLRSLIPVGNPRALCPQFEKGCPIHGGARQSFDTTLETPYRWRCRQGGEWWHDGAKVKNPTTGEEIIIRDDGSGWLAPAGFPNAGRRYYFVAAYRYFLIGKLFSSPYEPDGGSKYQGGTPIAQLALAYALTADARYARKAAVLLTRLADVYGTYDGCVEGPSQRQDGYIGQTFERFLAQNLILACDLVWDALDDAQRDHLQRDLLGYVYEYLHRLMPYFDGDFLMYEMTALAALASVLGNADIAAEAMESDTGLRVMLTNSWFRDGKYIYDSCGYNVGNARTPLAIAEWLHGLVAAPRYPKPIDVYNHPDYRMSALFDFVRHVDCDGRVPQIGDTGGSRSKSLRTTPPYDLYDERALLRLPSQRDFYAARLLAAAGGDLESYRKGQADWWLLFHAEDVPTKRAGRDAPPLPLTTHHSPSHLFCDSGIAILRAGASPETRQHVALTFSKGSYGHGHPDKLALNIMRYGYDLTADLGYPTTWTDIKAGGWEQNTASHCTVMLDERGQNGNFIGELNLAATLPMVDVVEASAERAAYPQASLYRRTVALVRDEAGEPLYTFDVFRVAGATTRDYLFHSFGKPEDLTVRLHNKAAQWTAQAKGSLAGENVAAMTAGGYGFLFDVQRARSDAGGVAVWRPTTGTEQPDRYLLTRQTYRNFIVGFTITRTGKASGSRERALFAFGVDATNPQNRRTLWLDAGGQLPIGKPIRVHIEVSGAKATMTMDGKPTSTQPEVVGSPPEFGSVGFLHYYNYAYDYDDFTLTPSDSKPALRENFSRPLDPKVWHIAPTHFVADGKLQARDSESVGLALHFLGAAEREIIRAKAEGYGVRGKSPLEGHLILRDRVANPATGSAFVAVIETFQTQPRIAAIDAMNVTPAADATPDKQTARSAKTTRFFAALRMTSVTAFRRHSERSEESQSRAQLNAVAVRVKASDRVDYVLSALDAAPRVAELDGVRVEFSGRFGLVTTRNGKVTSLACVGGSMACGGRRVAAPRTVRGRIVSTDVEQSALVVQVDAADMKPTPGAHILVRNERFVTPAVYEIVKVEKLKADTYRLTVNMPLTLARGVVGSVDTARGSFASRTPVMKLRVNRGLFDGKRVRPRLANNAPEFLLKSATESAFELADASGVKHFPAGSEYVVLDVGAGDIVEIVYDVSSLSSGE